MNQEAPPFNPLELESTHMNQKEPNWTRKYPFDRRYQFQQEGTHMNQKVPIWSRKYPFVSKSAPLNHKVQI